VGFVSPSDAHGIDVDVLLIPQQTRSQVLRFGGEKYVFKGAIFLILLDLLKKIFLGIKIFCGALPPNAPRSYRLFPQLHAMMEYTITRLEVKRLIEAFLQTSLGWSEDFMVENFAKMFAVSLPCCLYCQTSLESYYGKIFVSLYNFSWGSLIHLDIHIFLKQLADQLSGSLNLL